MISCSLFTTISSTTSDFVRLDDGNGDDDDDDDADEEEGVPETSFFVCTFELCSLSLSRIEDSEDEDPSFCPFFLELSRSCARAVLVQPTTNLTRSGEYSNSNS